MNTLRKLLPLAAIALMCIACAKATGADNTEITNNPMTQQTPDTASVRVLVKTTAGNFTVLLYGDTPKHRDNFVKLVEDGYYDSTLFHRVIKDFMIQGGDPEGTGMGGAKEKIKGEFLMNGVPNDLRHERGVISMARAQNPNSASSQFFICHKDSFFLDGQYAAFGRVVDGMDAVDEIAEVQTDYSDRPLTECKMKRVFVQD